MAPNTRHKILDAAEKLFARQGFESTSLRSIIASASVNLAAIHYHFRSKEGLIRAVIERRFAPVNDECLRLLAEFETQTARLLVWRRFSRLSWHPCSVSDFWIRDRGGS